MRVLVSAPIVSTPVNRSSLLQQSTGRLSCWLDSRRDGLGCDAEGAPQPGRGTVLRLMVWSLEVVRQSIEVVRQSKDKAVES